MIFRTFLYDIYMALANYSNMVDNRKNDEKKVLSGWYEFTVVVMNLHEFFLNFWGLVKCWNYRMKMVAFWCADIRADIRTELWTKGGVAYEKWVGDRVQNEVEATFWHPRFEWSWEMELLKLQQCQHRHLLSKMDVRMCEACTSVLAPPNRRKRWKPETRTDE